METKLTWQARDEKKKQKSANWYWMVGIVAVGIAAASVIIGNPLFAVIALIGAFAVMLAGSVPPARYAVVFSERGVSINGRDVPYTSIKRFALREDEPRRLHLDIAGDLAVMSLPLGNADFRAVRELLKNKNVEEVEHLGGVTEKAAEILGM
jgi:hypothetical protein